MHHVPHHKIYSSRYEIQKLCKIHFHGKVTKPDNEHESDCGTIGVTPARLMDKIAQVLLRPLALSICRQHLSDYLWCVRARPKIVFRRSRNINLRGPFRVSERHARANR
ncbi:hypothetical protein EVAR_47920_1 [Eumeta japonica]|uniref:Uncharacterized protein n=1 Tax=Eumeta variegata TaxID=151549 RepID=A0A4C1Y7K9_EUMVA|nr:hypothetical protein EVAR_47920_1 [Eumeta japonica]